MKSYTDLNQSRKLAEILRHDSADMSYRPYREEGGIPDYHADLCPYNFASWIGVPCWSLSALLDVLPIDFVQHKHYFLEVSKMGDISKPYEVRYYRFREDWEGADYGRITHISYTADNLIDACVFMIEELHEQKLL